jgi:hypothetical protein
MLPFLSLHALAAQRGDGLRPELLALFEPDETEPLNQVVDVVPKEPVK